MKTKNNTNQSQEEPRKAFPVEVDKVRSKLTQWFKDNPRDRRAQTRAELLSRLKPDLLAARAQGRSRDDLIAALAASGYSVSRTTLSKALRETEGMVPVKLSPAPGEN